jgi:hypothetical protein
LLDGKVRPTLEIAVTEQPEHLTRGKHPELCVALIESTCARGQGNGNAMMRTYRLGDRDSYCVDRLSLPMCGSDRGAFPCYLVWSALIGVEIFPVILGSDSR